MLTTLVSTIVKATTAIKNFFTPNNSNGSGNPIPPIPAKPPIPPKK